MFLDVRAQAATYSKIVATIGPATCNPVALKALERAGMSVARLNGSHADLDWHRAAITLIREVLPQAPHRGSPTRRQTLQGFPPLRPLVSSEIVQPSATSTRR